MTSRTHDIIVVGGGAAGLAAALELARHKRDVAVVEARDRLGGRILTLHEHELPIELGAEFLHGLAPQLQQVIEEASLRTCRMSGSHWFIDAEATLSTSTFFADIDEVFSAMRQFSLASDCSFSQFADHYLKENSGASQAIAAARRYVEGFNAASSDDVSVRWLLQVEDAADSIDGETQGRLVDGYDGLVKHYETCLRAAGVPVYLKSAVRRVGWNADGVELHTANGSETMTFRARRAIITLPIGILKEEAGSPSSVKFVPPLSVKQEAIDALAAGRVHRCVLLFSELFWNDLTTRRDGQEMNFRDLGFIHAQGLPIPTWWTQNPIDVPLLVGWAGGPAAEAIAGKSHEELRSLAVACLEKIFPVAAEFIHSKLQACYVHDWQNDPFTRCAYSYVKAGGIEASRALAEPIDDVLFFAGEATDSEGFSGTVHGAIRSGLRAASLIMKAGAAASAPVASADAPDSQ